MYSDYNFVSLKTKENFKKDKEKILFIPFAESPIRSVYKNRNKICYSRNLIVGGEKVKINKTSL